MNRDSFTDTVMERMGVALSSINPRIYEGNQKRLRAALAKGADPATLEVLRDDVLGVTVRMKLLPHATVPGYAINVPMAEPGRLQAHTKIEHDLAH